MKCKIYPQLIVLVMVCLSGQLFSQHYVPLEPMNKNVIYEEFTGVKCPNCPAGHTTMAQILADNPGRAFAVAYHPFNSSYTLPYTGDPDFRRHYADSLYMTPWCGTSRYMPSSFVARRLWTPGERLTGRSDWTAFGNTIMNEPSPLNVGMATKYDPASQLLTVTVDVYYTAPVTGTYNLMVTLAENNLQSQQSGATGTYTHKHTFREAFVGQWGDFLCENPQAGDFYTRQFTFNNSVTGYNMDNCELLAFVLDNGSTEVVSGMGCDVGDTTYITPDIEVSVDTLFFTTINMCADGLTATIYNNSALPVNLLDVQQVNLVPGNISWFVDPWPFTSFPYTLDPGDSVNLKVHVMIPLDFPMLQYVYDSLKITSEVEAHYLKIAVESSLLTNLDESGKSASNIVLFNSAPNPFSTETKITFSLPEASELTLEVVNISGQTIRNLASGTLETGVHNRVWNGTDMHGKLVPAGVYFYRLKTDRQVITRRVVFIR